MPSRWPGANPWRLACWHRPIDASEVEQCVLVSVSCTFHCTKHMTIGLKSCIPVLVLEQHNSDMFCRVSVLWFLRTACPQALRAVDATSLLLLRLSGATCSSQWFTLIVLRMVCVQKAGACIKWRIVLWTPCFWRLLVYMLSNALIISRNCSCSQAHFEQLLKMYGARAGFISFERLNIEKLCDCVATLIVAQGQPRAYRCFDIDGRNFLRVVRSWICRWLNNKKRQKWTTTNKLILLFFCCFSFLFFSSLRPLLSSSFTLLPFSLLVIILLFFHLCTLRFLYSAICPTMVLVPPAWDLLRVNALSTASLCCDMRPYGHGVTDSAYIAKACCLLRTAAASPCDALKACTYRFAMYQVTWRKNLGWIGGNPVQKHIDMRLRHCVQQYDKGFKCTATHGGETRCWAAGARWEPLCLCWHRRVQGALENKKLLWMWKVFSAPSVKNFTNPPKPHLSHVVSYQLFVSCMKVTFTQVFQGFTPKTLGHALNNNTPKTYV